MSLDETVAVRTTLSGSLVAGKYRLEKLIGEGGMGAVWSAWHLRLQLPVAIKLLHPGPDMHKPIERFRLEAQAAAQLSHPAIVRVFDVDSSEEGEPFIVMELLHGESLEALLERGPLSAVTAVALLLPIAEALVLAHSKGIVHRDLKPLNIFLARDGNLLQPKLLDFGIAKLLQAPLAAGLTDTGALVGSPEYMSPEQARGRKDVDHRADIWALSVVLYEALSGGLPFRADNYNAMLRAIVEDDPPPLLPAQDADRDLVEVIHQGLAKDRAARPQTMFELGRKLAQWLLDRGVSNDACGTSIAARWMNGAARRSNGVFHELADAHELPTVHSVGTMLSLEHPSSPPSFPQAPGRHEDAVERLRARWKWVAMFIALAVVVVGLGLAGRQHLSSRFPRPRASKPALQRGRDEPKAMPAGVAADSDVKLVPTLASIPEPAPIAAGTARPAQPRLSGAKPKLPAATPSSETPKPLRPTKPSRDEETRELLQAY